MLLNFLAGIVGGIWLLLLGEWQVVVIGLVAGVCGTFIAGLLILPSMLLVGPLIGVASATRLQHSPVFMAITALIGVGYTYCVTGLWAHVSFRWLTAHVALDAKIPILLWCYAVATSTWNYMAQQDARSGNEMTSMSAFFHQIACVSLMVYGFMVFPRLEMVPMIWWYAVPMGIALVLQVWMMFAGVKERDGIY
jgi:hypothetical protein